MLTIFYALALAQPPAPAPSPPAGGNSPATQPRQIAGSISDADYPAEAIRQGAQGTTGIRIRVTATGDVAGCEVEQSSGNQALDKASCSLVTTRFRYQPARSASGAPTSAVVSRRITWRLPADDPQTLASALPLLNFTSGMMRVTFGGTATERPRCAAEFIGTTFQPHRPLQCFGMERAELADLADEPMRVVTILRLQPEGASPPPPSPVAGATLISASGATIEVDPQGRIVQCTPVTLPDPGSAGTPQQHLCDSLYPGMPVFVPPGGSTNRRAAYQLEIYRSDSGTAPAA